MAGRNYPAPMEVTYKDLRFLITHSPHPGALTTFVAELKRHRVTTLVCVCAATYNVEAVERAGIRVLHWPLEDGAGPPPQVVADWLQLMEAAQHKEAAGRISVHCEAGLGHTFMLVALACMDRDMACKDAVTFIRRRRRGAFSSRQLCFLQKYQPRGRLRGRRGPGRCCVQCSQELRPLFPGAGTCETRTPPGPPVLQ